MREYEIIRNGESNYFIVTSQFGDVAEHYAASELQKYLYKSTGVFVPYFSDRCPKRKKEILVGFSARDCGENPEKYDIGEEGYVIRTLGEDILIAGKTPRGTLYGVYAFLERFLGFRAFTATVERINRVDTLILPETEITDKPFFEYRDVYTRDAWNPDFSVKRRLNSTLAPISHERGGNFKFFNCHHSFFDLVPPKYYLQEHPEYYSFTPGNPEPRQLCLSNPGVFAAAREQLRTWIRENPQCRVFSVAQNDWEGYCRCEACARRDAEEGGPAGSIIDFVNRLSDDIAEEYPDVLLHTFAYMYSTKAPRHIRPRKNVIVRLCSFGCPRGRSFCESAEATESRGSGESRAFLENLRNWSAITDRLYIWDYAVDFRNYLIPFFPFRQIKENFRTFKQYGVRGMLQEGNFSYGGDVCMGELRTYLLSLLCWNPDADIQTAAGEFFDAVFGKAAPYMKEYVRLFAEAQDGADMTIYDYADAAYITDALLRKTEELFDAAEKAENDPEILKRLRRERLSLEFMQTARIEDDGERARKTDIFASHVKEAGLTEIMERVELGLSFEFMKRSRYARERSDYYCLYYIVQ